MSTTKDYFNGRTHGVEACIKAIEALRNLLIEDGGRDPIEPLNLLVEAFKLELKRIKKV